MMPDRDIQAVSAVFRHLKLSHNDVTLPNGRRMPSECVYYHCTCVWAADGDSARVTTPWGLFDVGSTDLRVTPLYKVVIHKAYGRFVLTRPALRRLRELGVDVDPDDPPDDFSLMRHDPRLVQVAEELGAAASSTGSLGMTIETVTGPYRIATYDGRETIVEAKDEVYFDPRGDDTALSRHVEDPADAVPTEKAARRQAALRRIMYDKEPGALLVFHCKGEDPVAWSPFNKGFPPYSFVCPACGAPGLRGNGTPDSDRLLYDVVVLGSTDDQTAGIPRISE